MFESPRFVNGMCFNESVTMPDSATGRLTRRLTCRGMYNSTPTYHYNTAFSADSRYLVLGTARNGQSAVLRAELETGELTVLMETDGFGSRGGGNLNGPYAPGPHGGGFTGTKTVLLPASGWVLAGTTRRLLAVHLESGEQKVLLDDIGAESVLGCPGGSPDGTKAYVPYSPEHPDMVAGQVQPDRNYKQALIEEFGGCPTTILEIDIASGDQRKVYHDPVAGCNHVQSCPTDGDLLLIDRDLPPTFAYYGDLCQSPRGHILQLSTGELTPLVPQNEHQFQSHINWNRTGERIYYHGPAKEGHEQPVREGGRVGEMFVGVADRQGRSIWEINFPRYYYGHACTHSTAEAIVSDALVSSDLVTALHYEECDRLGAPRVEILARHDTDWKAMPGQYPHPHCHMSPDGRWLSYNRGESGRCDVYVVCLQS